jgi:predicted nucleic acid-binding protein
MKRLSCFVVTLWSWPFIEIIETDEKIDFPRDQKDAKFPEYALVSEAEFFITGDRDFEKAGNLVNTSILTVKHFKTLICDVFTIRD